MMNFPDNPNKGDYFNPGTGPLYQYDGVAWNLAPVRVATAEERNRIVNPGMRVAQESGGMLVTANSSYALDQYMMAWNGAMVMGTQAVQLATPGNSEWRERITVGTIDAAIAATEYVILVQRLEGCRIADFRWGTAEAKQVVLRFGFKGPAGTYSVAIQNADGTRSYVVAFTITAAQAGTDTVQTFVIPGDVAGIWKTDNSLGMQLVWVFAAGTTYQTTPGAWAAGNFLAVAAQFNGAGGANTFELFDVGFYRDPDKTGIAPPFILPDYVDDVLLCQRYFEIIGMTVMPVGSNGPPYNNSSWFKAAKRTVPTIAGSAGNGQGASIAPMTYQGHMGIRQTTSAASASDIQLSCFARM